MSKTKTERERGERVKEQKIKENKQPKIAPTLSDSVIDRQDESPKPIREEMALTTFTHVTHSHFNHPTIVL